MNIGQKITGRFLIMGGCLWMAGLTWAGQGGANFEVIRSASSTDGRTFTPDAGYRLVDGYVDAHVIKAETGNWLMLVSTTPNPERLPQQIYMARSSDGLTWQVNTNVLIRVPNGNALDPTAVALSNGAYRVYYIGTPTVEDPFSNFYLTSGVIQATSPTEWNFTPDPAAFGISGVSPEAVTLGNGAVRLYITSSQGGMKVYQATNGLAFTEESGALPQGSDPSVIDLGNGQMRMYYVAQEPGGLKEINTALSADGLNWTFEGRTGITNPTSNNAWGVPDSFLDPDHKTRLFWVAMPDSGSAQAMPAPIFSRVSAGIPVGKIQPASGSPAINFLNLSDAEWSQYALLAATAYLDANQIAAVVMDQASRIPYLTHSVSNLCTDYEALFGLADASLWATYAVDAAADLDGDGYVEYVVRDRASGYTYLVYTENGSNQVKTTGLALGLDPAIFANYRVEGGGDGNGDGYADLFIRDLATRMLYLVANDQAGGYGQVYPLFNFSAATWAQYRIESAGDYNGDGILDLVIQDSAQISSYKVFGIESNSYTSIEYIP